MSWRASNGRDGCNESVWELVSRTLRGRVRADESTGCWEYTWGVYSSGYGMMRNNGRRAPVHRLSYAAVHGTIPEGLVIDHMCRNRRCVNPVHLRACTQRENLLAPWSQALAAKAARRQACLYGHPYGPKLASNGQRFCRVCKNEFQNRRRAAKRAERRVA